MMMSAHRLLSPAHPRSRQHAFVQGMLSHRAEIALHAAGDTDVPRPVLQHRRLTLPAEFWPAPGALPEALCRAATAHALAHWRHSPDAQPIGQLTPIGLAVASTIEDARAESLLLRDYPGLRILWMPYHEVTEASGLDFNTLLARLARALFDPGYPDGNPWIGKARAAFEQQHAALDDYRALRVLAAVLANDLGQMRVRFAPDDGRYLRYRDDHTGLWAPDVETIVTARTETTAHTDAPENGTTASGAASEIPSEYPEAPSVAARHSYPEWDYRLGCAHPHWTTVLERPSESGALDAALQARIAADHLARMRRPRAHRTTRPAGIRQRYLQSEGDVLDIDASIALRVALRRALPPDPRVFTAIRPCPQDTSVLLLLDLSASTDARAAALEKRAACLLAESLDNRHHRLAIHGFNSDGRHKVYYRRFKEFDEPLDAIRRDALLRARSGLSTRLGAALRHAAAQVIAQRPRRLKIVLIGDGEPADIDVFDPRYLAADAAHAIDGLRRRGIEFLGVSFANGMPGTQGGGNDGDTVHANDTMDARDIPQHVYDAASFTAAMARALVFVAR